eukprot:scaffold71387_cov58-Attheya_sp.AAC.3
MTSMTRTYNALYLDGNKVMYLQFKNSEEHDDWHACTLAMKEEASRIVAAHPDPDDLSVAGIEAISNWLHHVAGMIEARLPLVPSIKKTNASWCKIISKL